MKQSEFLSSLIRNAYLPKEVPPVVTAKYFADFCEQEASFLEGQLTSLLKISTKYDTFTAPRFGHARRNLAIVHPLGQLAISLLISRNKTKIKKLISKDRTSYYDVKENREKSLAFSGLDFSRWKSESRQLFSEYAYVLKADISRFFYTVYTHSLPWAVLGKEKAKHWHFNKKKSLEKHWSSHLDKALQACQSRETFGIPVGPDTSRVIAEILVSDVAGATGLNDPANGSRMIRLVDDFLIGFHDERSAFKALAKLRNFLWTYNLQLNEVKTGVYASKTQYNESWEHDFETLHISEIDVSQQARDINKILDLTLSIHTHHPSANVINWSCSRLSLVKNNLENFELILEVLLRLGRDFPASLPHVCGFLINNQDICHSKKLVPKIERSLKRLVSFHHQHGHDSEVGWCLLAASVLRVSWDFVELASPDKTP